jgi:hypothetical protein
MQQCLSCTGGTPMMQVMVKDLLDRGATTKHQMNQQLPLEGNLEKILRYLASCILETKLFELGTQKTILGNNFMIIYYSMLFVKTKYTT